MFYQTETVFNEFVLYCHHSDNTRIYERNHLFERWREISKVFEGHFVNFISLQTNVSVFV